jgi:hypothetical protein
MRLIDRFDGGGATLKKHVSVGVDASVWQDRGPIVGSTCGNTEEVKSFQGGIDVLGPGLGFVHDCLSE